MIRVASLHIVVVGAARSGIAVARLLVYKGAKVVLTEKGSMDAALKQQLMQEGVIVEDGGHSNKAYEGEFLVLSPGVPTQSEIAQHYLQSGRKVFSEMEIASWFHEGRMIAITGTNGKTTVTSWLDHLWGQQSEPYLVGGNIGLAFSGLLIGNNTAQDALLEVSSFQLDHIESFKPRIAMILNITPDHLDRYNQSFESYAEAKFRIFENQDASDTLIVNAEDDVVMNGISELGDHAPKILRFSLDSDHGADGAFVKDGLLVLRDGKDLMEVIPVRDLGLRGAHNTANAMAVMLGAYAAGMDWSIIRKSLSSFKGVAHRMELVGEIEGIRFINDSKATNIKAVWYALSAFHEPLVLILGGRDKGNNWKELFPQLQNKVHTVIAIGEAQQSIMHEMEYLVPSVIAANSLEEAVHKAKKAARKGEIVLLSPACSSFDWFANYEDRGEQFKAIVHELSASSEGMIS